MSHPIARRAGMLALTAAMLMPSAGALSDVSSWAQEGVAAAQNAGLAPSSLSNSRRFRLSPAQSSVPLR